MFYSNRFIDLLKGINFNADFIVQIKVINDYNPKFAWKRSNSQKMKENLSKTAWFVLMGNISKKSECQYIIFFN